VTGFLHVSRHGRWHCRHDPARACHCGCDLEHFRARRIPFCAGNMHLRVPEHPSGWRLAGDFRRPGRRPPQPTPMTRLRSGNAAGDPKVHPGRPRGFLSDAPGNESRRSPDSSSRERALAQPWRGERHPAQLRDGGVLARLRRGRRAGMLPQHDCDLPHQRRMSRDPAPLPRMGCGLARLRRMSCDPAPPGRACACLAETA